VCEATAYLDGNVIMREVVFVENLPEGIRLSTLFDPAQVVAATLKQVDLMKHQVILETHEVRTHAGITDERDKIRVLIPHWMEHNAEHAEEFRYWASHAGEARPGLLAAAEAMDSVNAALAGALEKVGGRLPDKG
jgi:predicted RNA-binding protein